MAEVTPRARRRERRDEIVAIETGRRSRGAATPSLSSALDRLVGAELHVLSNVGRDRHRVELRAARTGVGWFEEHLTGRVSCRRQSCRTLSSRMTFNIWLTSVSTLTGWLLPRQARRCPSQPPRAEGHAARVSSTSPNRSPPPGMQLSGPPCAITPPEIGKRLASRPRSRSSAWGAVGGKARSHSRSPRGFIGHAEVDGHREATGEGFVDGRPQVGGQDRQAAELRRSAGADRRLPGWRIDRARP